MKQRIISCNFTSLWHSLICLSPRKSKLLWSAFWQYENWYKHLVKHHGKQAALAVLKEVHLVSKRVALGMATGRGFTPYLIRTSTLSSGIPRRLRKLDLLFKSDDEMLRRLALSISGGYLMLVDKPKESLKTVLAPYKGATIVKPVPVRPMRRWYNRFRKDPNYLLSLLTEFTLWFVPAWVPLNFGYEDKHIFSGFRAGPYGSPSFRYLPRDGWTLLDQQFVGLYKDCLGFANVWKGTTYAEQWAARVYAARSFFETLLIGEPREGTFATHISGDGVSTTATKRVARFTYLSEKGGKTRIITAASYWIQDLLFPFHHAMMNVLGRIPCDFAFDQERCGSFIPSKLRNAKSSFSFDMSGATDRFPRWFQALCLDAFRKDLGHYWAKVMSLPVFDRRRCKSYSFTCGQPMGIYSSWPVFSYSHHVLIRYCAWLAGRNPFTFTDYAILGDDISIFDEYVAVIYHYVLTVVFGVDISDFKSLICRRTDVLGVEFAKRLFTRTQEVSSLTPTMLVSLREGKDPSLIRTVVDRIINRWKIKIDSHSDFVCELFRRTMPKRRGNKVMSWFLSPKVLPPNLNLEGRLQEIRNEVYPQEALDSEMIEDAIEENLIDMTQAALKDLALDPSELIAKLYSLSNPYKGKRKGQFKQHVYLEPLWAALNRDQPFLSGKAKRLRGFRLLKSVHQHHLQAVMQVLSTRLEEASEAKDAKSVYRLLVLSKQYKSFFEGKIVRGRFYSQVRKVEVLSSFSVGKRVKRKMESPLMKILRDNPLFVSGGRRWLPYKPGVSRF